MINKEQRREAEASVYEEPPAHGVPPLSRRTLGEKCESPQSSVVARAAEPDKLAARPLSEQLENLQLHLRKTNEVVGRELYAIVEARIARLTAADLATLKHGLSKIDGEVKDINQMVMQLQVSLAIAEGQALRKRTL